MRSPVARRVDRVESLWEPLMILAAQVRESLGLPGMTQLETIPFRDKEAMKQVLDNAGIRTPHHYSSKTADGDSRCDCQDWLSRDRQADFRGWIRGHLPR